MHTYLQMYYLRQNKRLRNLKCVPVTETFSPERSCPTNDTFNFDEQMFIYQKASKFQMRIHCHLWTNLNAWGMKIAALSHTF